MISEASFMAALERAINAPDRSIRVQRINSGTVVLEDAYHGRRAIRGAKEGTADLVGLTGPDGLYLEVETKSATGKPSDRQLARARAIRALGGVYVIVYADKYDLEKSVREAIAKIDEAIAEARAPRPQRFVATGVMFQ